MIWLLIGSSLAANPYADRTADVTATGSVGAAPPAVFELLRSTRTLPGLFPGDCATNWNVDDAMDGVGAKFSVQYRAGSMRRSLRGMVSRADGTRSDGKHIVELDHDGAKGFVTRFTIDPEGSGSSVTMTTYLNPPPWPFRKVFYTKIQPGWTTCHERALVNLDALVLGR
jgi:hypothetical protein